VISYEATTLIDAAPEVVEALLEGEVKGLGWRIAVQPVQRCAFVLHASRGQRNEFHDSRGFRQPLEGLAPRSASVIRVDRRQSQDRGRARR
jgi:hypothetical protein